MAQNGSYESVFTLKDKVSGKLDGISKKSEQVSKKVNKAKREVKGFQGALQRLDGALKGASVRMEHFASKTKNIRNLGNKITDVGKGLTVGVTLPIIAMGGAMVKAAADIESMQQQLSTMLGSAEKGAAMFDEIKTMAAKTPFETKDLMAATNTMLGFGIAQEKVIPLMNQLGDISGGNAARFQSLALAFSQVSSAGKLQGQDLLQMINAGFNPLESIAKRTGKSVGYWKEQMSKGKVTVEMVEQAMKDATSEGGRFFNMMQKQSQTSLGQWSTFQDNLNMLLADFGKIILPYAIKGLQKLSSTLEWFNSLSPGMKKTILIIGGISAAIGPIVIGIGGFVGAIASLNTAFLWLAANPIVLTIAAWTAGIVGLINFVVQLIRLVKILVNHLKEMSRIKTPTINTNFDNGQLQKLSDLQASMGKREFAKTYGKDVAKAVNNYNKTNNTSNVTNSNNTTSTTNITNNNYGTSLPKNAQYSN